MLLVTKTHHERDETKGPDKESLHDIGQVCILAVVSIVLFRVSACIVPNMFDSVFHLYDSHSGMHANVDWNCKIIQAYQHFSREWSRDVYVPGEFTAVIIITY